MLSFERIHVLSYEWLKIRDRHWFHRPEQHGLGSLSIFKSQADSPAPALVRLVSTVDLEDASFRVPRRVHGQPSSRSSLLTAALMYTMAPSSSFTAASVGKR